METIVLSGPADQAAQARQMLKQQGLRVEESLDNVPSNCGPQARRDYNHGFEQAAGEAFVTCYGDVNDGSEDENGLQPERWGNWAVTKPLGFELRMHWSSGSEGKWDNPRSREQLSIPDPVGRLARVEAALRAAGIQLPEED